MASKQDLTSSANSLTINDVSLSLKEYKKTRTLSRALVFGLVVSLCICLVLVIALAVVVTRYSDRDDDKTTPSTGTVILQQQQPQATTNNKPGCSTNNKPGCSTNNQPGSSTNTQLHTNTNQSPLTNNNQAPGSNVKDEYCMTTDCIRAASLLSESIDETVDPCEDFYQFTCGNWRRRHVMTEDQAQIGTFDGLIDDVSITLKNVLEKAVDSHDVEAVKKAKNMYQSCMNEEEIENTGLSKIIQILEDLGGWPALGSKPGGKWKEGAKSLEQQFAAIRQFSNSPPIMDMYTYDDSKDTTKNILYIDQPQLGMPDRKYFLKGRDDKTLKAYENYAVEVAKIFGADANTAITDTAAIIEFEIQIANMSMPADQRRDDNKLYNKMPMSQLRQNYPDFDWMTYFTTVLGVNEVQITVTDSESVIVRNPDYINRIFKYTKTVPKRVISNYIAWRMVNWVQASLPENIRDAYQAYRKVLVGTKNSKPRWKHCTSSTNTRLGLAVGRLFVHESFDPAAKKNALEMIENLRSAMKNLIRGNDWMDESTKTVAIEKADYVSPRIGYYDDILKDGFLNHRYENFTVHNEGFFQNTIDFMTNNAAENLRKLRKPVDRITWDDPPATVNAFYNGARNQISFPAGILQPPFYHKNYPETVCGFCNPIFSMALDSILSVGYYSLRYLNYGGIGYVIGHEITHGFDDQGRLYDKNGELKGWWTQKSIDAFKTKAQCIEEQYGNYVVPEANKKLNGKLTLGENIADNGGVKESFYAYKKWVNEHGEEAKLPGLKYTPYQLFFLNGAHVWCGKTRPAEALRRVIVDPHSNAKSRVIGPPQNFDEFSKAFNCRKGSVMNPVKKCLVW